MSLHQSAYGLISVPPVFNLTLCPMLSCVCCFRVQKFFDPNCKALPPIFFHGEGKVDVLSEGGGSVPSSHVDFPHVLLF